MIAVDLIFPDNERMSMQMPTVPREGELICISGRNIHHVNTVAYEFGAADEHNMTKRFYNVRIFLK